MGEGKPGGKGGMPGNPMGGLESMEAMETMEREEGGKALAGGEVAGEAEDGEEGGELFANLNCVRSVGAGGAGIESILELSSLLPSSIHRRS